MRFTQSITQNLQARPKVWVHLASSIPSAQSPQLLPGSAECGSPTPQVAPRALLLCAWGWDCDSV